MQKGQDRRIRVKEMGGMTPVKRVPALFSSDIKTGVCSFNHLAANFIQQVTLLRGLLSSKALTLVLNQQMPIFWRSFLEEAFGRQLLT